MIVIFTICLTYFWLLIFVFQIQKSSFSQATCDLQQYGNLHLWVKLKYFGFVSTYFLQKLEELLATLSGEWKKTPLSSVGI